MSPLRVREAHRGLKGPWVEASGLGLRAKFSRGSRVSIGK